MEASVSIVTLESVAPKQRGSYGSRASVRVSLWNYPSWIAYLMALFTICAGVFSSTTSTWMNKQNAPSCSGCEPEPFVGAMLQTQQMFIAECIALIVWLIDNYFSGRAKKAPLFEFVTDKIELTGPTGRWWFWPCCAVCDFAATLMINHAYQYTFAATVEMLRNFMVVMAAVFQVVLIRKSVTVHQWLGVLSITVAMILTAIPAIISPDDSLHDASATRTVIGVALAVAGTTVQAFQLLVEEWLFRKGRYPPLKAVGLEGITGMILTCIAWPIYQNTGAEDITGSWYQLFHNRTLIGVTLGYLPCGTIFNICGLGTTKLAGGLLRGVCFAVRAPLVWLVSMIVKWQSYDNYSLASAIVFALGFTVYCNFYGLLGDQEKYLWLRKPVPCFCTKPELDDPPFGPERPLYDEEYDRDYDQGDEDDDDAHPEQQNLV
ncbi:putative transmembrane protein [Gregarina niphandrodes]|uniref:Transmembrane protein n=1 Tax=Gregarina niphandrodes TaxID=110365 RepID=A0A023BB62_GRENI|nr:putative transmembrane protein [Gregarina niphandrodes]EZG79246.1 putative transmembrane protein [Gregarina niphandrodes]|eukprot:XP_011129093.1 putative transmembrane protein [Gregarina niphandrodes]